MRRRGVSVTARLPVLAHLGRPGQQAGVGIARDRLVAAEHDPVRDRLDPVAHRPQLLHRRGGDARLDMERAEQVGEWPVHAFGRLLPAIVVDPRMP